MATLAREPVYTALFSRLQSIPGIATATRLWIPWEQIGSLAQPALVMFERDESPEQRHGRPAKWTLSVDLLLYAQADQSPLAPPPMVVINNLIDAIDAAIGPDVINNVQSLGGLADHAWIEGKIEKDPGILDGQAFAIIPVKILVPL